MGGVTARLLRGGWGSPVQERLVVSGLLLLLLAVVINSAWLGDDFYIGLRSFDNFLNGHGLRWNVAERVQVFTDPLWYFVLTPFYAATGETFVTTIVLAIVTSMAAVFVLVRYAASSFAAAAAALVVLISSRAFIDYTTSGLENSLSFLLTALFCVVSCRQPPSLHALRQQIFLSSLVGFNRLDLMLMLFPAVAYTTWIVWREQKVSLGRLFWSAVVCSLPLSGWLLFSTIYFGYPFPNTYYAKLHTGLPRDEQIVQGMLYFLSSINFDPVTLAAIFLALCLVIATREPRLVAGGVGVIFYLLYVVKIGGDFMNGRFFSVPLLFVLCLLVHLPLRTRSWAVFAAFGFALGLLAPRPTLLYHHLSTAGSDITAANVDVRGIADERSVYFTTVGLLPVFHRGNLDPVHGWVQWGREARQVGPQLVVFGTPGMYGYFAGPEVRILDYYALGDPLLSKLPMLRRKNWRVGHYLRGLPEGYVESIQTGENRIVDPTVRELYRVTKILAQDPIWSVERFTEIAKMNLGYYKRHVRKAAKSKRVVEPPSGIVAYPLLGGSSQLPVKATVTSTWAREMEGSIPFWWTNKDVRLDFEAPEGLAPETTMVLPMEFYGRDVTLEFIVNGQRVEAERRPGVPHSRFVPVVLRGPWRSGANSIKIIGGGEPVQPPGGHDPRELLFAIREPAWE